MKRRPEWISKNEDGKDSIHCAEPEVTVQLARYGCISGYRFTPQTTFPIPRETNGTETRAMLVAAGTHVSEVRTIADWALWSESYPVQALEPETIGRGDDSGFQVRAYFLRQAISKLLKLVDAPSAMIIDIEAILDRFAPKGAVARGKVQQTILDDPAASLHEIADRTGTSPSQITKDGKAGLLFWPASSVGTAPSSTP